MSEEREARLSVQFPRRYREWLRATHTRPSQAAKIAYCILAKQTASKSYKEILVEETENLLRTVGTNGVETLLRWRMEPWNLDLLQLSVLCSDVITLSCLIQEPHVTAAKYKGGTSDEKCKNHPVHLACALGQTSCLWNLLVALETVPWEQGLVALPWTKMPSFLRLAVPPAITSVDLILGSPVELAMKCSRHECLPILFQRAIREANVEVPLSFPLVKNLLNLVSYIFDDGNTRTACTQLRAESHHRKLSKDLLQLFCEFLFSGNFSLTANCSPTCLPVLCKGGVQHYEIMSKYLTPAQLETYCTILQRQIDSNRGFVSPSRGTKLSCSHTVPACKSISLSALKEMHAAFVAERRNRNLQWRCALALRRHWNGDPRAAWKEGSIPGGLRHFFPVPFQNCFQRVTEQTA